MSEFSDNMAALVEYFNATPLKTRGAAKIRDEFANWNNSLGWYDKNVNTDATWNKARDYRLAFDRANAVSDQEKAAVERVQNTGLSSEKAKGETEQAKTSEGLYGAEKAPWIPAEYKVAVAIAVVGGVIVFAYGFAGAIPSAVAALLAGKKREL